MKLTKEQQWNLAMYLTFCYYLMKPLIDLLEHDEIKVNKSE